MKKNNSYISLFLDNLPKEILENGIKLEEENDESRPFLTVLTRTQGKRLEMLNEVLLCLTGQSDTDFEVLIVGHNISDGDSLNVENLIENQPSWLKEKVRFIKINGGSRSTPLNYGFSEAKGDYISILDDDDIVFDHWVESFHKLSEENFGKILHCYSVSQHWETIDTENKAKLVAVSEFGKEHCRDFDIIDELSFNCCPTMSLAFPRFAFKDLGIRFNENLNTTEDWDFLMRTAFLCGVVNSNEITSIYRFWDNSENSHSFHDEKEWTKNYYKVQSGFYDKFLVTKIEGVEKHMRSIDIGDASLPFAARTEFFVDIGNGFNPTDTLKTKFRFENGTISMSVEGIAECENIRAIRYDPDQNGIFSLNGLKIEALDENEQPISLKYDFFDSRCVDLNDGKFFVGDDPYIIWKFEKPINCKKLTVTFLRQDLFPTSVLGKYVIKFFFIQGMRKFIRLSKVFVRKLLKR